MKLNPDLLRSVAVGIGLGVALTSCSLLEADFKPKQHEDKCTKEACAPGCEKAAQAFRGYDCPGCGMG